MIKSTAPGKHAELAEKIVSRQIGAASPAVSPDGKYLAYVVTASHFVSPLVYASLRIT